MKMKENISLKEELERINEQLNNKYKEGLHRVEAEMSASDKLSIKEIELAAAKEKGLSSGWRIGMTGRPGTGTNSRRYWYRSPSGEKYTNFQAAKENDEGYVNPGSQRVLQNNKVLVKNETEMSAQIDMLNRGRKATTDGAFFLHKDFAMSTGKDSVKDSGGHLHFGYTTTEGDPMKDKKAIAVSYPLENQSMYAMGAQISGSANGYVGQGVSHGVSNGDDRAALIFTSTSPHADESLRLYHTTIDNDNIENDVRTIQTFISKEWPEFELVERAMDDRAGYLSTTISKGNAPDTICTGINANIVSTFLKILKPINQKRVSKGLNELNTTDFKFEIHAPELRKLLESSITKGGHRIHFYTDGGWMRLHHDNHTSETADQRCRCAVTFLNVKEVKSSSSSSSSDSGN